MTSGTQIWPQLWELLSPAIPSTDTVAQEFQVRCVSYGQGRRLAQFTCARRHEPQSSGITLLGRRIAAGLKEAMATAEEIQMWRQANRQSGWIRLVKSSMAGPVDAIIQRDRETASQLMRNGIAVPHYPQGQPAGPTVAPGPENERMLPEVSQQQPSPKASGTQAMRESDVGQKKRLPRIVNSALAATRMEDYLKARGIGQTEFATQVGTTDRTLRNFRRTGKLSRDIFDAIARGMGLTREELLKPE